jgi:hypothetical protein
MLDPLTLDPGRAGRGRASGNQPGRRQVAFLPQIRAEDPHLEVLAFDAVKPALQHAQGRIDRDRLVVIGWRSRSDRTSISAVLPEQRPRPPPVSLRETAGVAAEQMLDGILVAAGTCGGMVLDAAPGESQEADPERRELWAA